MPISNKKIFGHFPLIVALLSAIFVYWLLNIYGKTELKRQKRENKEILHRQLDNNRSEVEQTISGQQEIARSLADYIEFNPNINQQIFSDFTEKVYLKSNQQTLAFEITQNDFVEVIFPKFSDSIPLKINLKQPSQYEIDVYSDSITKEIIFIEPNALKGQPAIVYQNFIFVHDSTTGRKKFWGNAVIVDDLTLIVSKVPFKNTDNRNFNLEIYSPAQVIPLLIGSPLNNAALKVSESFNILNLQLSINLSSEELALELTKKRRRLRLLFISIALIIAFLNAYLLANMVAIRRKNKILENKNIQIKAQLSEKVLLINEIHHRIKNHFQLISSLNRISSERLKNKTVEEVIDDVNRRIHLMAEAYDQISGVNRISNYMPDYIPTIVNSLISGVEPEVRVSFKIDPIDLSIKQAVYLGIILNELVINTLKHGFILLDHKPRIISIAFQHHNGSYKLTYLANGIALPDNILETQSHSTGVQMLSLFTEQLKGEIHQIQQDDLHGFGIKFPLRK